MKSINHPFWDRPFFRFLLAGGCNTAFSYFVYLAFIRVFAYPVAFSVSFAAGIISADLFNSLFVFRTTLSKATFVRYPFIYVGQYFLGLALLSFDVKVLGMDDRIAPLVNVIVLVPVTFALNKWILAGRGK
jgi:putative flippase GtrA